MADETNAAAGTGGGQPGEAAPSGGAAQPPVPGPKAEGAPATTTPKPAGEGTLTQAEHDARISKAYEKWQSESRTKLQDLQQQIDALSPKAAAVETLQKQNDALMKRVVPEKFHPMLEMVPADKRLEFIDKGIESGMFVPPPVAIPDAVGTPTAPPAKGEGQADGASGVPVAYESEYRVIDGAKMKADPAYAKRLSDAARFGKILPGSPPK